MFKEWLSTEGHCVILSQASGRVGYSNSPARHVVRMNRHDSLAVRDGREAIRPPFDSASAWCG